jgi:FixJ family two-component response regulator
MHGGVRHKTEATPESEAHRQRPRVLIVDDDPSVLRSMKRLLDSAGFEVSTFDGPAALLAAETPRYDACLVLDFYLPGMNAVELAQALSASGRGLPKILITGRDDEATRRLAGQSDAVGLLFKPIAEAELLEAVGRALARNRPKVRHRARSDRR